MDTAVVTSLCKRQLLFLICGYHVVQTSYNQENDLETWQETGVRKNHANCTPQPLKCKYSRYLASSFTM